MSYAKMAQVYDILMEDAPYDKWENFATQMFEKFGVYPSSKIADLGCGTGQITRRLRKQGYQMTGVDNSADMLTEAQHAAMEEQLAIEWYQQDLRELDGFQNFDAVTSFCDVINYIIEVDDIKSVFRNVNHMLRLHGLFLFDVHSVSHVESEMKDQTFAEIYDDISYVWLCHAGEHLGEVYHDLTFFVLDENQYERFDESHHQRTFSIEDYDKWLVEQGFESKGIFADFSVDPNQSVSGGERIFFVYEKIRES